MQKEEWTKANLRVNIQLTRLYNFPTGDGENQYENIIKTNISGICSAYMPEKYGSSNAKKSYSAFLA